MLIELERIQIPPDQHLLIENVSWQEFESILEDLGERRNSRIAYKQSLLEIMTPSFGYGVNIEIVGDLIKVLLEEHDIEFRSLGSTTFKKDSLWAVEPDQCFYVENETKIGWWINR